VRGQVGGGRIDEAIEVIGGLFEQVGRRRGEIKLPIVAEVRWQVQAQLIELNCGELILNGG